MLEKTTLFALRNYRNLWQPKGLFHPIFNDQLLSIRSVYFRSQYYSKHKHTQGCALRKISGSPSRSQPCQLGRPAV